ncbi:hypothetical protein CXB51_028454 [Gossypium anomalum]|uniref:DUF4283 domain-containing protein n=1 Tax=Gossypium anomalum TaxID=47600 RepID=A0A8J5XY40_9ROSI|nr:hypothetical protein CXB51_028454 [Gossypium anomalum]
MKRGLREANKVVMYRVVKSLWFTKELAYFLAMTEGIYVVKFGNFEDRTRMLNLAPWLFDNCLFTMLPYGVMGEVVGIDWRDRDGYWIGYLRVKFNIDISNPLRRVVHWVGNEGTEILCGIKYERLPTFCYSYGCIGHSTQKCLRQKEIPGADKSNFQYGNWLMIQLSMPNQARSNWRNDVEFLERSAPPKIMKILCGNYHGIRNLAIVRELKQLLVANSPDIMLSCETKIYAVKLESIWVNYRMASCLGVDPKGRNGGLAIMWKDGIKVIIQNNCSHHIDSLVKLGDSTSLRFIRFYGFAKLNLYARSWDLLKSIRESVREDWIVGGDFNAILNDSDKFRCRKKSRVDMEDFQRTIEELALVDIKIDKGWLIWSKNREGNGLIKERLDRFLFSTIGLENTPFLSTYVVRQACSDHDAVVLDSQDCYLSLKLVGIMRKRLNILSKELRAPIMMLLRECRECVLCLGRGNIVDSKE